MPVVSLPPSCPCCLFSVLHVFWCFRSLSGYFSVKIMYQLAQQAALMTFRPLYVSESNYSVSASRDCAVVVPTWTPRATARSESTCNSGCGRGAYSDIAQIALFHLTSPTFPHFCLPVLHRGSLTIAVYSRSRLAASSTSRIFTPTTKRQIPDMQDHARPHIGCPRLTLVKVFLFVRTCKIYGRSVLTHPKPVEPNPLFLIINFNIPVYKFKSKIEWRAVNKMTYIV